MTQTKDNPTSIQDRAQKVLAEIDAALTRIAATHEAREQEFLAALIEIRGNGRTLNTEEMTRARIFYNAGASASRTLLPTSLRMNKTAIEGLLYSIEMANSIIGITWGWDGDCGAVARAEDIRDSSTDRLTTLCDQHEALRK